MFNKFKPFRIHTHTHKRYVWIEQTWCFSLNLHKNGRRHSPRHPNLEKFCEKFKWLLYTLYVCWMWFIYAAICSSKLHILCSEPSIGWNVRIFDWIIWKEIDWLWFEFGICFFFFFFRRKQKISKIHLLSTCDLRATCSAISSYQVDLTWVGTNLITNISKYVHS